MSGTIKAAIQALKGRIADAYTAIVAKGGTLPATQDSANLPAAIASIPSGGGALVAPMSITFTRSPLTGDFVMADLIDTQYLTSLQQCFQYTKFTKISLVGCDLSNITSLYALIADYVIPDKLREIDMENCDTSHVTMWAYFINSHGSLEKVNLVGCSFAAATNLNYAFNCLSPTFIGDYTLDDVLNNGITILNGARIDFSVPPALNRASKLAIIRGVADLTGQAAKNISMGVDNLEPSDIAEAYAKNWTLS